MSMRPYMRATMIAAAALALSNHTHALTINLVHDPIPGVAHADDPTSSKLTDIIQAAANHWELIVPTVGIPPTEHAITINYRWASIAGQPLATQTSTADNGSNRNTASTINFDTIEDAVSPTTARRWFFDPTPNDDSEYTMVQTFYEDLTGSEKTNFINGTAPDRLEITYGGQDNGSDPNVNFTHDLLTVAMHEIGHALGLDPSLPDHTNDVFLDGDYDTNPQRLGGTSVGIRHAPFNNTGHLAADPAGGIGPTFTAQALMAPSLDRNVRLRPSTLDVLAADGMSDWFFLNLRRKEVITDPDVTFVVQFFDDNAWAGGFWPSGTDVAVRHGGAMNMFDPANGFEAGDAVVHNLIVGNDSLLLTSDGTMTVFENTTIDTDATMIVGNSTTTNAGSLDTDTLNLGSPHPIAAFGPTAGTLRINNGIVTVTADMTINNPSLLESFGGGSLDIDGTLDNDGTIRSIPHPDRSDTLFLFGAPGALIDLDGTNETGRLEIGTPPVASPPTPADPAQVWINLIPTDPVNTTIDVNEGSSLTLVTADWTLGTGGTLNLLNATLNGGTANQLNVAGTVNVTGTSNINMPVNFLPGGAVIVNSTLKLNDTTQYNGTNSFTGNGDIQHNAPVTVLQPTTIDVTNFDLDGQSENNTVTLNDQLTLNVDNIDLTDDSFDGQLNINAPGRLTVNNGFDWTMNGSLDITGPSTGTDHPTSIDGVIFNLDGTANIQGQTTFAAPVAIQGAIDLTNASSSLHLAGPGTNSLVGGQITGLGKITTAPGVVIRGSGEFAPAAIQLDPTSSLNAAFGTLEIPGGTDFTAGTIGAQTLGTLIINNPWATSQVTQLKLQDGTVDSAPITNDGTTAGQGTINTTSFNSTGTIDPQGILNLNTPLTTTTDNQINLTLSPSAGPSTDPTPGTDNDQLNISGPTTLDGTINLATTALPEDFTLGLEYDLITFDTAPTPSAINIHTINNALINTDLTLAIHYLAPDASDPAKIIARTTLPGDTNRDNQVSVADLSSLAENFTLSFPLLSADPLLLASGRYSTTTFGDFNADGQITVADLSLLALNFGSTLLDDGTVTPPTPLSLHTAARLAGIDPSSIPEPATIISCLAAAPLLLRHRRRR